MNARAAVIGAGSWGTAFAGLVAQNVDEVRLWCHSAKSADAINGTHHNPRYIADYELPANVVATSSLGEAVRDASVVVLALPSVHLRRVSGELAEFLARDVPVITLTKGIEAKTGMLMTEVAADELGSPERFCALSGPNHAEEVHLGMYSAAVLAGVDASLTRSLLDIVATPKFRVYVSPDVRGVETCGAVKNVIAIACGMAAGTGLGDNTLAVIMTRGIAEIGRVVNALGGDPMTCMGLAGMGDLVATCTSKHSRNRRFGEAFSHGISLRDFERESHMVVEGANAVISVRELAHKMGVDVPITEAVWGLVHGGVALDDVVEKLVGRPLTHEFYGMGKYN